MKIEEIDEKIAEAEAAWKKSIGDTKRAYEKICKELYAEKKVLEEAARRTKGNLN